MMNTYSTYRTIIGVTAFGFLLPILAIAVTMLVEIAQINEYFGL